MSKDTKGTWKIVIHLVTWAMIFVVLFVTSILLGNWNATENTLMPINLAELFMLGFMGCFILFLSYIYYLQYLDYFKGNPGLKKTFIFRVIGVGSVVIDAKGVIIEITDIDQWFWNWEWKSSPYSSALIILPPKQKQSFGLRHTEIIGSQRNFYWGYNFSVQVPVKDLAALSRLKLAIGEEFAEKKFTEWWQVVNRLIGELNQKALVGLDLLADANDPEKQNQFKHEMRELIIPGLEIAGLTFLDDELIFQEEVNNAGNVCSYYNGQ